MTDTEIKKRKKKWKRPSKKVLMSYTVFDSPEYKEMEREQARDCDEYD